MTKRRSKEAIADEQPFAVPPELHRLLEPVEKVRTYEGNARRGDVDAIKTSLEKNGIYRAPIARRETGEILVNNHTVIAARELGATHLPIDWRSIESDEDARAIVLVDNATSDLASYNYDALATLLEQQAKTGRGLDGTGFDQETFTKVLGRAKRTLPELPDPEPIAPPEKPKSKIGQAYKLGRHTLVCGDATDDRHIQKALRDVDQVDAIWTDPPYGVDLGPLAAQRGRDHGSMAGDNAGDHRLRELLLDTLYVIREVLRPGGAIYLCHADAKAETVHGALREAGLEVRQILIWRKDALVLGRQDYQWQHEAIAYGWRPGGAHRWYGGFDKTTVIEGASREALEALEKEDLVEIAWRLYEGIDGTIIPMARPRVAELHPTVKPAELVAKHIRNSTVEGGHVLDPFAGAGTTLVAAEQTGRTAHLVELDPGYCDVIRKRWEDLNAET